MYKSTTLAALLSLLLASNNSDAATASASPFALEQTGANIGKDIGAATHPATTGATHQESHPAPATPLKAEEVLTVHPEIMREEPGKSVPAVTGAPGEVPKSEPGKATETTQKTEVPPLPAKQVTAGTAPHPQPHHEVAPQQPHAATPQQPHEVASHPSSKTLEELGITPEVLAKAIASIVHKTPAQETEPATQVPHLQPLETAPHPQVTEPATQVPHPQPLETASHLPGTEPAGATPTLESGPPVPITTHEKPKEYLHTYLSKTQKADSGVYQKEVQAEMKKFNAQIPSLHYHSISKLRVISWNLHNSTLGGDAPQKLNNAIGFLAELHPSVLMLQQLPSAQEDLQGDIRHKIRAILGLTHIVYCQDAKTLSGLLIASKYPLVDKSTFRYMLNATEGDCFALRTAIELKLGEEYEPLEVNVANITFSPSDDVLDSQLGDLVPKLQSVSTSPLIVAGTTNKSSLGLSASFLEPVPLFSVFSTLKWEHPGMTHWDGKAVDHAYTNGPMASTLVGAYEGLSLDSDHLPTILDFDVSGLAKKKVISPAPVVTKATEPAKGTTETPSSSASKPSTSSPVPVKASTEAAKGAQEQAQKSRFFWRNAAAPTMNNANVLPVLMVGVILLLS